jgi:hypothetical protein
MSCSANKRGDLPFVVPKAAVDAVRRMQARERLNNFALLPSVIRQVIACHYDQVCIQGIGHRNAMVDLACGHEGANVDVRKLHNAKALEGLGQPSESDTSSGNLESDTLEDKAVGRSGKPPEGCSCLPKLQQSMQERSSMRFGSVLPGTHGSSLRRHECASATTAATGTAAGLYAAAVAA